MNILMSSFLRKEIKWLKLNKKIKLNKKFFIYPKEKLYEFKNYI